MIRRPAGCLGIDPAKPKLGQIEFLDKDVNHPNRIVLADPVFQAFRKQRALPAIRPLNKALHPIPPQIAQESYRENQMKQCVFTQARSLTAARSSHGRGCFTPKSCRADRLPSRQLPAIPVTPAR